MAYKRDGGHAFVAVKHEKVAEAVQAIRGGMGAWLELPRCVPKTRNDPSLQREQCVTPAVQTYTPCTAYC